MRISHLVAINEPPIAMILDGISKIPCGVIPTTNNIVLTLEKAYPSSTPFKTVVIIESIENRNPLKTTDKSMNMLCINISLKSALISSMILIAIRKWSGNILLK